MGSFFMLKKSFSTDIKILALQYLEEGRYMLKEICLKFTVSPIILRQWRALYQFGGVEAPAKNKAKLTHSISRVGRCIDNGPIEAFWGTLKVEKYYSYKSETYEALKGAIDTYIKFYKNERYQEKLNGLSPLEYRTQAAFVV